LRKIVFHDVDMLDAEKLCLPRVHKDPNPVDIGAARDFNPRQVIDGKTRARAQQRLVEVKFM